MRLWTRVAFILIFTVCMVQIVSLCLWFPKRHSNSLKSHRSTDTHTSFVNLEERFYKLPQEGKKLGLSESDMVWLLGHVLRRSHHGELQGSGLRQDCTPPYASPINQTGMGSALLYPWCNISSPVNPHDYELVINQPNLCKKNGSEQKVFLLVLMLSSPANFKQREMQRKSCLSLSEVFGRKIKTVFILGDSGDKEISTNVVEESAKHHDILQENFRDTYRNLTVKTLMGMKWTSIYCSQAEYILKSDDDVFLSLENIIQLTEKAPRKNYMTGHCFKNAKPLRSKKSKWYISEEEYPRTDFPPYCSGIGYIVSGDLPPKIFTQSLSIPYIFLEDVFIGLCLEKLNVVPTINSGFFPYKKDYDYCMFKNASAIHLKKPEEILHLWITLDEGRSNVTC